MTTFDQDELKIRLNETLALFALPPGHTEGFREYFSQKFLQEHPAKLHKVKFTLLTRLEFELPLLQHIFPSAEILPSSRSTLVLNDPHNRDQWYMYIAFARPRDESPCI